MRKSASYTPPPPKPAKNKSGALKKLANLGLGVAACGVAALTPQSDAHAAVTTASPASVENAQTLVVPSNPKENTAFFMKQLGNSGNKIGNTPTDEYDLRYTKKPDPRSIQEGQKQGSRVDLPKDTPEKFALMSPVVRPNVVLPIDCNKVSLKSPADTDQISYTGDYNGNKSTPGVTITRYDKDEQGVSFDAEKGEKFFVSVNDQGKSGKGDIIFYQVGKDGTKRIDPLNETEAPMPPSQHNSIKGLCEQAFGTYNNSAQTDCAPSSEHPEITNIAEDIVSSFGAASVDTNQPTIAPEIMQALRGNSNGYELY
ncbi:MAG: hypothetical protein GY804_08165 [Alphaproteobacteria bacterium]|nr:hypothetical protein [Alphaproteobacteria bacterium]